MNLLNPYSLATLLKKSFPPLDWIWEGFVAKGDFVLLAGEPKIGKSLVTFLMTILLSRGQNFAGLVAPMHRKILYIDAEMSAQTYQERLKRFDDQEHAGNSCFYYENCIDSEGFFQLTDPDHQNHLLTQMEIMGVEVLILDNLFSLAQIEDYNKPNEYLEKLKPFVFACRQRRITCILIDHLNKEGKVFGSQGKVINVDLVLTLIKSDDIYKFEVNMARRMLTNEKVAFSVSDNNEIIEQDWESETSPVQFKQWMVNNYPKFYPVKHARKADAVEAMYKNYEERYGVKPNISLASYISNHAKHWH